VTTRATDARVEREMPRVSALANLIAADWPETKRTKEDVVASGYLGLVEASRLFDPLKNDDFSRFAYKRYRGAMLRYCATFVYKNDSLKAIFLASLTDEDREEAKGTAEEMLEAAMAGTESDPRADVRDEMRRRLAGMAIGFALADLPVGGEEETIGELERRRACELIRRLVTELPSRQQEVLRMIYTEELTHEEIGKRLTPKVDTKTVQRDHDKARGALDVKLRRAGIDRPPI
jgi:RNA polymerase sigma factor (sigma-70 family)